MVEGAYMKQLCDCCQMAGEISFCAFGNSFSTPSYESALGEPGVAVLDFHKRKLYSSIREFVNQVDQFTL